MALLNTESSIIYLQLDKIAPNPYQPRKFFDKDNLDDLARSIKEYGIMQPLSVRLINGTSYELVAGERRLRAARIVGLETIPAIIVNINDKDSAIVAMIENIQRENLNYIEEAIGFSNLLMDYSFTQEALAERLGKSQSTIANKIRLLKLSKRVQKLLVDNNLSERHARALIRLSDEFTQIEVVKKILKDSLTVIKTEELVEKIISNKRSSKKTTKVRRVVKDIRLFNNSIMQSITLMKEAGYETEYIIDKVDQGCEILIKVSYPKDAADAIEK